MGVMVYNTAHLHGAGCTYSDTVITSALLYSPVDNAGAEVNVTANGTLYTAEADQAGASFNADVTQGAACGD
jgi:hypothetical protein